MSGDENRFTPGEIRRSLERIEKDVHDIKEDMDRRLASLEKDSATHCADIDWLKRGYWMLAGMAVTAILEGTFLIIRWKFDGG